MGRFDLIEVTTWAGLTVFCNNYKPRQLVFVNSNKYTI